MAKMIFSTKNRHEAHGRLEEVLAEGEHPRAECREDPNAEEPYQVWSASEVRDNSSTEPTNDPLAGMTPEELAELRKLHALIKKG